MVDESRLENALSQSKPRKAARLGPRGPPSLRCRSSVRNFGPDLNHGEPDSKSGSAFEDEPEPGGLIRTPNQKVATWEHAVVDHTHLPDFWESPRQGLSLPPAKTPFPLLSFLLSPPLASLQALGYKCPAISCFFLCPESLPLRFLARGCLSLGRFHSVVSLFPPFAVPSL